MSFSYDEEKCYVCGQQSPEGLKLKFEHIPGGRSRTAHVFEERHQGYDNIVHGGILAAVLDDTMSHAIIALGLMPVTIEMTLRYRRPTYVGEEMTFEGEVNKVGRRVVDASAKGIGPDGQVRVEAEGKFIIGRVGNRNDVT
jgi:uncharacterized protein (TIGR00369 family)